MEDILHRGFQQPGQPHGQPQGGIVLVVLNGDHYQLLCDQIEFELRQAKDASAAMDLFKNCDSMESLSKRKKTLLSIFHPDNEYGDNEITRMILAQYNKKKESICK